MLKSMTSNTQVARQGGLLLIVGWIATAVVLIAVVVSNNGKQARLTSAVQKAESDLANGQAALLKEKILHRKTKEALDANTKYVNDLSERYTAALDLQWQLRGELNKAQMDLTAERSRFAPGGQIRTRTEYLIKCVRKWAKDTESSAPPSVSNSGALGQFFYLRGKFNSLSIVLEPTINSAIDPTLGPCVTKLQMNLKEYLNLCASFEARIKKDQDDNAAIAGFATLAVLLAGAVSEHSTVEGTLQAASEMPGLAGGIANQVDAKKYSEQYVPQFTKLQESIMSSLAEFDIKSTELMAKYATP